MGGSTAPFEYSKAMFELSQSMQWTRLEQTLQIGHFAPLAIPIPDELVSKQDWNDILIFLTTWIQNFLSTFLMLDFTKIVWNTCRHGKSISVLFYK